MPCCKIKREECNKTTELTTVFDAILVSNPEQETNERASMMDILLHLESGNNIVLIYSDIRLSIRLLLRKNKHNTYFRHSDRLLQTMCVRLDSTKQSYGA